MAEKKRPAPSRAKPKNRASITFPDDLYLTLAQIAKQQKVSIAWVIRDAAEKYVNDRWPLLDREGKTK